MPSHIDTDKVMLKVTVFAYHIAVLGSIQATQGKPFNAHNGMQVAR